MTTTLPAHGCWAATLRRSGLANIFSKYRVFNWEEVCQDTASLSEGPSASGFYNLRQTYLTDRCAFIRWNLCSTEASLGISCQPGPGSPAAPASSALTQAARGLLVFLMTNCRPRYPGLYATVSTQGQGSMDLLSQSDSGDTARRSAGQTRSISSCSENENHSWKTKEKRASCNQRSKKGTAAPRNL